MSGSWVVVCDGADLMLKPIRLALQNLFPGIQFVSAATAIQTKRPVHLCIYSLFGNEHQQFSCPKLLLSGEPDPVHQKPGQYLIDCKLGAQGTRRLSIYYPFYVWSFGERFQNTCQQLIKSPDTNYTTLIAGKSKFCAFLYSQEVPFRNQLFDQISQYKPVDALGKARNRNPGPTDRRHYQPGVSTYNDMAVKKYLPYKFVICCENSRKPGYITEKAISAMLAGCVPIYLGAQDVAQHFNLRALIHVPDYPGDALLQRIREIDENPELHEQILREPWFPNNELPVYFQTEYLTNALRPIALGQSAVSQTPSIRASITARRPMLRPGRH